MLRRFSGGGEMLRETNVLGRGSSEPFEEFRGWHRPHDRVDCRSGIEGFGFHKMEQEFHGRVLPRQRDGREEHGTPPGVGGVLEILFQAFECQEGMRGCDGECRLSSSFVGGMKELTDAGNCADSFDRENTAVADSEDFRFVLRQHCLGTKNQSG